MELNFVKAIIGLILGLVSIIVLLPIAGQLVPTIGDNSGQATVMLISAMILLIVAGLIFRFVQDAQGERQFHA